VKDSSQFHEYAAVTQQAADPFDPASITRPEPGTTATITFENVQNVKLRQGPLQRHFGIANVMVDTAGGSSDAKQNAGATSHQGIIEGVTQEDAARLRDLILVKLRRSATAGLGDDQHHHVALATGAPAWLPEHLALLRDIRDDLASLKTVFDL
jgi:hypothetical protein